MPIMARKPKSDFVPAPAGPAQGVCVDVVDLGMVDNKFKPGTKQPKVRFVWEISKKMPDGRPFIVNAMFTNSTHEKASMRKFLEAWRGRPFKMAELAALDLEKLLGANALLNLVQNQNGEDLYTNIASVSPLLDGMPKMKASGNYKRVQDRDGYVPPVYEEEVEREPGLDDEPLDKSDPMGDEDNPPASAYGEGDVPF